MIAKPAKSASVLLVVAISAWGLLRCARDAERRPLAVEIWHVGDDALTLKVNAAIETAFAASPSFVLAPAGQGDLVMTIPTNVRWERSSSGTRVNTVVQFSTRSKRLKQTAISCMADEPSACAAQVVNIAEKLARRLR